MPETFYVTTPIYYVNDAPHIGHAYTTVLADVLARSHRLLGHEVFFLTGTDEHGQKVQQAAEKRGVTPKAHTDAYAQRFRDAWTGLGIGYDHFLRTTDPAHIDFVRTQAQRLWDCGEVYSKEYAGWYSTAEERFFAETELVDGNDPVGGRPVEWIQEKNYFFKMSAYQDWLLRHLEAHPDFILPDFRRNEVLGFLRQPLADLCISRPKSRLAWGVSLPFDEDYVAYVWVDALLNYVSAVSERRFAAGAPIWPADAHLIGKDILTTHAVYWPTLLQALGLPQPRHIVAHGWWLVDNARMSKTTGNVVSPLAMKDKYGVDAFRYFLLREMAVGQDAAFSEEIFVTRYNADLANDLGNGLSRVLKLGQAAASPLAFATANASEPAVALRAEAEKFLAAFPQFLADFAPHRIPAQASDLFRAVNRYLEHTAPWKLAKGGDDEKRELAAVLWQASEALRLGFTLLLPIMPTKMRAALDALGIDPERSPLQWNDAARFTLRFVPPLFPRIAPVTAASASEEAEKAFDALDLRTVRILTADDHPQAESLYILRVDLGDGEIRTVCAGLRKHVAKVDLPGKIGVLVANLKPASLRGVVSQGMLLAAEAGGRLMLAQPQSPEIGLPVGLESRPRAAGDPPKPMIGLKEFEKCPLTVQGQAVCYGRVPSALPLIAGGAPIRIEAPDGVVVR